jgi:protein involved in polysaccharide export with SLBB domain
MLTTPRRNLLKLYSAAVAIMLGIAVPVGTGGQLAAQDDRPQQTTAQPQKGDTQKGAAQKGDTVGPLPRAMATRAELEAIASGKKGPTNQEDLAIVRERLAHGDLQAGDRISLRVIGEQTLTDTFTVKPTRTVLLPNIGEIPLDGVLRSELNDYLKKQIGRFIRDPQLEATALVRVNFTGAVGKPGFYNLPADVLASDAIMAAGGPGSKGDVAKTEIRRSGYVISTRDETAAAIQRGESLDQLNIQSGDEIVVGNASQGITGVLKTMGMVSGALFGIVAISRLF